MSGPYLTGPKDDAYGSSSRDVHEAASALLAASSAPKRRHHHSNIVQDLAPLQRYQSPRFYEKDRDRISRGDTALPKPYQYGLPNLQQSISSGRSHDFASDIPNFMPGSTPGHGPPTRLVGASLIPQLKATPDTSINYASIINQICQTIAQPLAAIQIFSPLNVASGSPVINITDHINQIIRIASPLAHPTNIPTLDSIILTTTTEIQNFKESLIDRVDEMAREVYEAAYEKRYRNRIRALQTKVDGLSSRNVELLEENKALKGDVEGERRKAFEKQVYRADQPPVFEPTYVIRAANDPRLVAEDREYERSRRREMRRAVTDYGSIRTNDELGGYDLPKTTRRGYTSYRNEQSELETDKGGETDSRSIKRQKRHGQVSQYPIRSSRYNNTHPTNPHAPPPNIRSSLSFPPSLESIISSDPPIPPPHHFQQPVPSTSPSITSTTTSTMTTAHIPGPCERRELAIKRRRQIARKKASEGGRKAQLCDVEGDEEGTFGEVVGFDDVGPVFAYSGFRGGGGGEPIVESEIGAGGVDAEEEIGGSAEHAVQGSGMECGMGSVAETEQVEEGVLSCDFS